MSKNIFRFSSEIFFISKKKVFSKYVLLLQPEICPGIQKSYLENRTTNLKSRKSKSVFIASFSIYICLFYHFFSELYFDVIKQYFVNPPKPVFLFFFCSLFYVFSFSFSNKKTNKISLSFLIFARDALPRFSS